MTKLEEEFDGTAATNLHYAFVWDWEEKVPLLGGRHSSGFEKQVPSVPSALPLDTCVYKLTCLLIHSGGPSWTCQEPVRLMRYQQQHDKLRTVQEQLVLLLSSWRDGPLVWQQTLYLSHFSEVWSFVAKCSECRLGLGLPLGMFSDVWRHFGCHILGRGLLLASGKFKGR